MTERKIEETNSDRMVQKNRAPVPQPVRAGTGTESQTYEERTGVKVTRNMDQPHDDISRVDPAAGKNGDDSAGSKPRSDKAPAESADDK